jgi:hypothetical protein
MSNVVMEMNTKTGQETYYAGKSLEQRTLAIDNARRFPLHPEAMAMASVLAARDSTKTFVYEVLEVP